MTNEKQKAEIKRRLAEAKNYAMQATNKKMTLNGLVINLIYLALDFADWFITEEEAG